MQLICFSLVFLAGLNTLASSQERSFLNTPPILYIPDRNWRIYETEVVGQVIARVRAEDAENDHLIFGLEHHFHYNSESNNGSQSFNKLPFRIDHIEGVVYLNESIKGRGGENFLMYVTVSDGQLTAKSEIFVNILKSAADKNYHSLSPPSVAHVLTNISQFLTPLSSHPIEQSIKKEDFIQHELKKLAFGSPQLSIIRNISNTWKDKSEKTNGNEFNFEMNKKETTTSNNASRTKLTPLQNFAVQNASSVNNINSNEVLRQHDNKLNSELNTENPNLNINDFKSVKVIVITLVIGIMVLFLASAVLIWFLYRKRYFTMKQNTKQKMKEEITKISNQDIRNNLNRESCNSMVMQQWNGPTAFNNRYTPWERDQTVTQNQPVSITNIFNEMNTANAGDEDCSLYSIDQNCEKQNYKAPSIEKCDRWVFPRHRLKFFNILGEGAFGQVWRCEATDIDGVEGVTTVAVKTLKENASEIEKRDLLSELEVLKSLDPHVNVVRLLGCCTDKSPIFVIIEYINGGKLQTYLRNSRTERHYGNTHGQSNRLTSGDLTSFMYHVAKGMDYLTSRGIIHRDLAARNILITNDHICKIADFGFARDIITSRVYERKSEGKLPIRWMAIESLYDNIFTAKSDVWSFGILMWEIVTLGSTPYPGISAPDVMRKVLEGFRLEKPEHCRRELYNIMYYCWSKNEKRRPTFAELVQMLDKLLQTEMDYIQLECFSDHNYYNILHVSGEKL